MIKYTKNGKIHEEWENTRRMGKYMKNGKIHE
jgi:hypothetical protein